MLKHSLTKGFFAVVAILILAGITVGYFVFKNSAENGGDEASSTFEERKVQDELSGASDQDINETEDAVLSKPQYEVEETAGNVEESDKQAVLKIAREFLTESNRKNGTKAVTYLSEKTTELYNQLYYDVFYTPKEKLLVKSPITVAIVTSIRTDATKETLGLTEKNILSFAISNSSSDSALSSFSPDKLSVDRASGGDRTIVAKMNYDGKPFGTLTFTRENGAWKLDYVTLLSAINFVLESDIRLFADRNQIEREEALAYFIESAYFYKQASSYQIWTPLSARYDLQPLQNIRFASYTDPLFQYTMRYPEGWEIDMTQKDALRSVFFIAPAISNNALRGSVVVNAAYVGETAESSLENIVNQEENFKKAEPGGEILSKEAVSFKGYPAYKLVSLKLRTFDGGKSYIKQKTQSIMFKAGPELYNLDYKHNPDDFEQFKLLGEEILSTIVIRK
ncbi:MAG: hypothetical protein Q8P86_03780 [bacterium]|nr:hypothetical protein [bacterium]